ncbi:hypothetical protein Aeh1ORF172c [Aeromonas phage Aeh1]|uniref:Uncharacterized protein n=1 Tax=Aeromonas phage Aeh1 TaxID=2880362 RepID=Q76YQ8_9CAUD|nr:hypothetical protein Aeh1p183 [Aeromonas phage Aeh1]AAQ17838.1 hypothetical protein Aeh1ORF172c [Aeromonas phage Aeh1]
MIVKPIDKSEYGSNCELVATLNFNEREFMEIVDGLYRDSLHARPEELKRINHLIKRFDNIKYKDPLIGVNITELNTILGISTESARSVIVDIRNQCADRLERAAMIPVAR